MKRRLFFFLFILSSLFFIMSCGGYEYNIFGNVSGIVIDNSTGEPIVSATVTLSPGSMSCLTGADGKFEFTNLTEGQYTITVQRSGYQSNRKNITAISGETVDVAIPLSRIQ